MMISQVEILTLIACVFTCLLLGLLVVSISILSDRRRRTVLKLNAQKNLHRSEIVHLQLEVTKQSIQEVAAELHDNLGQKVSIAKLYVDSILCEPEASISKIQSSVELLGEVMDYIRNFKNRHAIEMIHSMGLYCSISKLVNDVHGASKIKVSFSFQGDEGFLDEAKQLVVFRIIQESVNNVLKHSRATELRIILLIDSISFSLRVEDNGIGFDPACIKRVGSGLGNMQMRANSINASFAIKRIENMTCLTLNSKYND
jgi:signal transduction histidine kinase